MRVCGCVLKYASNDPDQFLSWGDILIPGNPFSVVMLTAKKALDKQNLTDHQQLIWKKSLIQALKDAEYSSQKTRQILHFIRF